MTGDEFASAYAQERLIFDVTELIARTMKEQGVNRAELARRLGYSSRAGVTRILSGSTNLTLRSLADVFRALGAVLNVSVEIENRTDDIVYMSANHRDYLERADTERYALREEIATLCAEIAGLSAKIDDMKRDMEQIGEDDRIIDAQVKAENEAIMRSTDEFLALVLGHELRSKLWGPELEAFGRAVDKMKVQLARVTKQRDEAWGMVQEAYNEAWGAIGDGFVTRQFSWRRSAAKLALDAARAEAESPTPDMNQEHGIWRCEACGDALPESCIDPNWRWAGDCWQHAHGQAGHIDARYFARAEAD